jgi:lipoate-protein ligase A
MNMAVDEVLLAHAADLCGMPLLRVYGWDRPAVSIGYAQRFSAAASAGDGCAVVRRPTGGGVVWHDRDLTYTAVVPSGHPLAALDRLESYHVFHRAVIRLLAECGICARLADSATPSVDRATLQCFVSPTVYDVLWSGGKAAGAAQRRTRDGILHQGSILLAPCGLLREELAVRLRAAVAAEFNVAWREYRISGDLCATAAALAAEKYDADEWNRRH